jgi:hypothetical protein
MPKKLTGWYDDNVVAQSAAYLTVLFLICMVALWAASLSLLFAR